MIPLLCGFFWEKCFYLLVGPVLAATFGRLNGGHESEKLFMFCIHIWIPHEILSILSKHTWGNNESSTPPPHAKKTFLVPSAPNWDQMWSTPSDWFGHFEGQLGAPHGRRFPFFLGVLEPLRTVFAIRKSAG